MTAFTSNSEVSVILGKTTLCKLLKIKTLYLTGDFVFTVNTSTGELTPVKVVNKYYAYILEWAENQKGDLKMHAMR